MITASSYLNSAFINTRIAQPITIIPHDAVRNGTWNSISKASSSLFFDLVCRDLPGADLAATVEVPDRLSFNLYCKQGLRTIFHAEDCRYDGRRKSLCLAADPETDVRAADKGTGFGKVFLENILFGLPQALDIRSVDMIAGREDGAFFWSRRGGVLFYPPDDISYRRFESSVRRNLEKMPQDVKDQAEAIFAEPSVWANVRLANLPGQFEGRPVGATLLKNTNPSVSFHLDDPEQIQFVRQSMGNMTDIRAQLRDRYQTPVVGTFALTKVSDPDMRIQ